jgi:hypothetical protein
MKQEWQTTEPNWEIITQCIADSFGELSDRETGLLEKIFSTPALEPSVTRPTHHTRERPKVTLPFWEWGRRQLARLVQA